LRLAEGGDLRSRVLSIQEIDFVRVRVMLGSNPVRVSEYPENQAAMLTPPSFIALACVERGLCIHSKASQFPIAGLTARVHCPSTFSILC
jgi:hypothetical protein